ncbi:MAG: metal ABC transporter ATP-binding protein [Planctomycetota bacterium]|jgi:ABC-type Mn2+/Zn2+ transport system ATPase subunit
MTLLSLHQADLGYRQGQVILDAVDLAVEPGDFLLLAGSNGSGKSTLIRSLLGTLPLLKGRRDSQVGLRLGYVPQQLELDAQFPVSVEDVVRMGTWGRGRPENRSTAAHAIRLSLEAVAMEKRQHDLFGQLSGGQKQRVLLARSLAMKPGLFLLDEPVSGVDARATSIILDILSAQAAAGTAVVLVSHQPLALRERVSRSVLVKDRRLEELPVPVLCSAEGLERLWA